MLHDISDVKIRIVIDIAELQSQYFSKFSELPEFDILRFVLENLLDPEILINLP